MTKQLSHIIVCVWLSVLLVCMGGGIGMLRCAHGGGVEIVQLQAAVSSCRHGGHCCGGEAKGHTGDGCKAKGRAASCMHLDVVQLSPVTQAAAHTWQCSVPVVCLPPQTVAVPRVPIACLAHLAAIGGSEVWHGPPPRRWLAIISVLLI